MNLIFITSLSLFILQATSATTYASLQALLAAGKASRICTSDSDCVGTGWCLSQNDFQTLIPNYEVPVGEPEGLCVNCWDSSAHCSKNLICLDFTCTQCQTYADCALALPTKPYCSYSLTGNSCHECSSTELCLSPDKSHCITTATIPFCGPCVTDNDCSRVPGGKKICSNGICVECLTNFQCASTMCRMTTKTCEGQTCSSPTSCESIPTMPVCLSGHCASCGANPSFCSSQGKICSSDGSCKQCYLNQHCLDPLLSQCSSSTCQVCAADSHCSHLAKRKCLPSVGCVSCLTSSDCQAGYSCTSNRCEPLSNPLVPVSLNSIIITLFESEYPDTFVVELSRPPTTDNDVAISTTITLLNINSTDYVYIITKKMETQFLVIIKPTTTIPPTILYLTYRPPNSQQQLIAQIATKRIPFITQQQKEISETMKTVSEATLITMASLSGSMIILAANPAVFFNLVETMQSFYYLNSINVKYPPNAQIFFTSFAAGSLEFIPNPIKSWLPSVPAPRSVGRMLAESSQSTSSNLFLANAGNMMFVWIALIVIFILVLLAKTYLGCISKWITKAFNKIFGWLHWSGVLRILMVTYPKLTQAALIQVNSMAFDSAVFIISAIFGILFLLFGVIFPLIGILIIKRAQKDPEQLKTKFSPLIGEFSLEGTMPKYFTAIALLRRLITLSSQVFLREFPYAQVSLLTALGVVNIGLLAKFRPYAAKSSNVIMILSELLFTVLHVLILVGVHDDQTSVLSDSAKINLGWGMLGCSSLILAVSLEACIFAQIAVLKAVIKALQKKKQANQVLPMEVKNEKEVIQPRRTQRKVHEDKVHIEEERSEIMGINAPESFNFSTSNTASPTRPNLRGRVKNARTAQKIQRLKEMNQ